MERCLRAKATAALLDAPKAHTARIVLRVNRKGEFTGGYSRGGGNVRVVTLPVYPQRRESSGFSLPGETHDALTGLPRLEVVHVHGCTCVDISMHETRPPLRCLTLTHGGALYPFGHD